MINEKVRNFDRLFITINHIPRWAEKEKL